jgi:glycosyltransferase involved in cell wall biosynthesis
MTIHQSEILWNWKGVFMAGLSIVLPTYNEITYVAQCLDLLLEYFRQKDYPIQIIVVDSGSTDGTTEYLQEKAENCDELTLIVQKKREGVGSAFREAYHKVNYPYIAHYECDIPFTPESIMVGIEMLQNGECDFVLGQRTGTREGLFRYLYSFGYRLFLFLMFRVFYTTINYSYKIFKVDVVKDWELYTNGWFSDAELVIETSRRGYKVKELEVPYTARSLDDSSVRFTDIFRIIGEAFQYKGYIKRTNRKCLVK